MRPRNLVFMGCLGFAFIMLMGVAVLYLIWTAPPDVPVPPAPASPPDNACAAYVQLIQKTAEVESRVPGLARMAQQAMASGASKDTIRRYVSVYEPIRREIRQHLNKPSVYIDVPMTEMMRQNAVFRNWARVEEHDIRLAFMEGDHLRAIDDLRTVLLLSEQLRHGAPLIRFLVAEAMQAIAMAPVIEQVESLSAGECDRLVAVIREWEQVRVPFWQALENEKRYTIRMYHAMWQGGEEAKRVFGALPRQGRAETLGGRLINLRRATREAAELYDRMIAEARKPVLQRQPVAPGTHPLNRDIASLGARDRDTSAVRTARLRMLGCAAAVRAYRLRNGRYPTSLAEAGVSDLNSDPFTGSGFVYRVGERGFLLYSVGFDGKDDGGKRVPEAKIMEGTGDLAPVPYRAPGGVVTPGAARWLR